MERIFMGGFVPLPTTLNVIFFLFCLFFPFFIGFLLEVDVCLSLVFQGLLLVGDMFEALGGVEKISMDGTAGTDASDTLFIVL